MLQVMVGIVIDSAGRVLLAQRQSPQQWAGCWEFPGGKLEPGEAPAVGLARELKEELGIEVEAATRWRHLDWRDTRRELAFDVWQVHRWRGTAQGLEGQPLHWCQPQAVDPALLAPADRVLLHALRLPAHYPISSADLALEQADAVAAQLQGWLARGERLFQLRLPQWPREAVRELVVEWLAELRQAKAQLLLHDDIEGALRLGEGVGVHLPGRRWLELDTRPLPWQQLVAVSCHDGDQLARAARLSADFATLSPVAPTSSHPATSPLGWAAFQALTVAARLPVYALGGLGPDHLAEARAAGAQGVAGIRGFA